ncbi:MAG: biopolymer transporter ExbD [Treponema sp.]|nr:biopolymer transporter ExbD [Treponema sp.]
MKTRRSLVSHATVDLIPMIDVVFQLILFFLVSTTFAVMPAISLKLPTSSTALNSDVKEITITVTAGEKLYLNDKQVTIEELSLELHNSNIEMEERISYPVVLEADELVTNGFIVKIFDVIRQSGFVAVNLRTSEN